MYRAIRVPVEIGEKARLQVLAGGFLDPERKILKIKAETGFILEIPVMDFAGERIGAFSTVIQEKPEFSRKPRKLEEYLNCPLTEEELAALPSGWQVLGDIIIVNIKECLESKMALIAKALLEMYPKCKTVVRDLGIEGQFRQPKRELVLGSKTETIHKEHGCLFRQDVTKVMYSKGNLAERKRMSLFGKGEVVVDMFTGIGYFSIPMAVHSKPKKIICIEINPESYRYLEENIKLNHVEDIIVPLNGDCAELTPEGLADRVLMGYVGTTHHYLVPAIKALKKEGGILHYHETVPENLAEERPVARIKEAAEALGKKVEILGLRKIKKYSPGVIHVVADARIFN